MKKLLAVASLAILALVLSGCVDTSTLFDIDEQGMMAITLTIRADESMAGNDVRAFVWGLMNAFPELQNNYTLSVETQTIDYSDYLFYTLRTKENISTSANNNITFQEREDGTYSFELRIPKLLPEISEGERDTRAYEISVKLPKEIDMANSQNVEGQTAIWTLYYHDLAQETTLKAFTK